MTTVLDLDALTKHDNGNMLGAISTLPAQLRDGLARARNADEALQAVWPRENNSAPRTVVVCGMGGSGVGADLVPAAVSELGAPVIAVKGYDIPSWVTDEDRVICCSYSGMTSETLSCFEAALERSVVAAVITTGGDLAKRAEEQGVPVIKLPTGMQPRAAVGVLFGALLGACETLGVVGDAAMVIEEAAKGAQFVIDEQTSTGPEGAAEYPTALRFAQQLHDHVVIVYGAEHTEAVAHRWKAQINENTKMPCWASAYPELDHNELVGWEYARETGAKWGIIELIPHAVSDAIQARFDITKSIAAPAFDVDLRFEPRSTTRAGATFELLVWGDYISVYGALLRGVDPTPVNRIHTLKSELAGR